MAQDQKVANQDNGDLIETIESEEQDRESSPVSYEILTYPADFTLEVLVDKWKKGDITIPKFQRRFVWTQAQSSKLIESFLLGLPVPSVFLYSGKESRSMLVVDGQQRLKTIGYFFEGFFGEEERGRRPVFRLAGLNENSPYVNKTYKDLQETDDAALRKLNDSVLRSFVIKQLNPEDDTSIYHIFERLNTGGTLLQSQEIRNCVYHGQFNELLGELNKDKAWRDILGKRAEDKRLRDMELILRFFALLKNASHYEKPMKDFLSRFMSKNRDISKEARGKNTSLFGETTKAIVSALGEKPFHIRAGLNAAVYDSVFTAFAKNLNKIPPDIKERYKQLVSDKEYERCVSSGTTDKEVVSKRLDMATKRLFGASR